MTPPAVYVADFGNNRVLEWKSTSSLTAGNPADVVIGQNDFASNVGGGPGTNESTGLFLPVAVAVDAQGNVYIADGGNNRILRFPKGLTTGTFPNLVIGQASFSSGKLANQGQSAPSSKTLYFSANNTYFQVGMAFDSQGNLWVTDAGNNRASPFAGPRACPPGPSKWPPTPFFGPNQFRQQHPVRDRAGKHQSPDLQIEPGSTQQRSRLDASGRLYIADALCVRVLEFQPNPNSGQPADRVLGVASAPPSGGHLTYPHAIDPWLGGTRLLQDR